LVADVPTSIRVLQHLRDNAASEKVRAEAARTLLHRAGLIAPRAAAPETKRDLSLHEMSIDDLRDLAGKLEADLSGRAKDVSSANGGSSSPQSR
jgi:hypothetical protein